jgi:hypothetical protein
MQDYERELGEAAAAYREAKTTLAAASDRLAKAMRVAYRRGRLQSEILRLADHVWSREYLRIILGLRKGRR